MPYAQLGGELVQSNLVISYGRTNIDIDSEVSLILDQLYAIHFHWQFMTSM